MPKKPFTPEEIAAQRERIMDSASHVMAEVGFHHLSMRKLASQLGMTASNIYNYFPNKESLFVFTRRRGFEMAFQDINEQMSQHLDPRSALYNFAGHLIQFAQRSPGYYQLMFQPPRMTLTDPEVVDRDVLLQVDRLGEERQAHLLSVVGGGAVRPACGAVPASASIDSRCDCHSSARRSTCSSTSRSTTSGSVSVILGGWNIS